MAKADKRFHEGFVKKAVNQILVGLLIAVSYLPFWFLYRLSDLIYLFVRYVFRYRYKVITTNLNNAFPEKSNIEIARIRDRFYHHFCDMIFESVKMYSMTEKQMGKHIQFKGIEIADELYEKKQSLVIMAIHHNNWEWCSSVQSKVPHLILMVYNPIRGNEAMERFLLHSREKWGGECVPVYKTARTVIQYNAKGRTTGLWLAADQTPPADSKFWTMFLNQETPFFSGPEKIAHTTNQSVIIQYVKKTGRGKYLAEYSYLFEKPGEMDPKDILLGYIRKSEEIIRQEPEYYLWSHRRWKHKRPDDVPLTI